MVLDYVKPVEVDKNNKICYTNNKEYLEKLNIYKWLNKNNFFQGMRHDCLIVAVLEKLNDAKQKKRVGCGKKYIGKNTLSNNICGTPGCLCEECALQKSSEVDKC